MASKNKELIIGFSTGCLYKTQQTISARMIDFFRKIGCNAIELNCPDKTDLKTILEFTKKDFTGFKHISVHSPRLSGKDASEILDILETIHKNICLDCVIIHPDEIADIKALSKRTFPIGIENMDSRKKFGKTKEELESLFKDHPNFGFVLDVNHVYTNDPSMKLSHELSEAFGKKTMQSHLSGFVHSHDPLSKTHQTIIIDAVPKNTPIIIESVCNDEEEATKEFKYLKTYLESRRGTE